MSQHNNRNHTAKIHKILLVHDEAELLLTMKAVLLKLGYEVTTAAGYEEAHGALRGGLFDLVVSDLRLNGQKGHGLQVAAEAKKAVNSSGVAPAVVLVTGNPEDVENSAETVRACVDEYLFKPVKVERLLACISRALEKSGPRLEVSGAMG